MAITTHSTLKASIRDWSHRGDLSDALIDDFIRMTEEYAFSYLDLRDEEARATNSTGTTSRFIALPAGYRSMRKLQLFYTPNYYELIQVAPESISVQPSTTKQRPKFYTITTQLELDVIPDLDYTIEMQYFKSLTGISSSNTTNDILTNYPSIYQYGCLYHMFDWSRDEQRSGLYFQKFNAAIEAANEKSREGRYGVAPSIRIEGSTP